MTKLDPFFAATFNKALTDYMDTACRNSLRQALLGHSISQILLALDALGGHEWLAVVRSLPPMRRKKLQMMMSPSQLGALREAISEQMLVLRPQQPASNQKPLLREFISSVPTVDIRQLAFWRENINESRLHECAKFVYFTTPQGRLYARTSLVELATFPGKTMRSPQLEKTHYYLDPSISVFTAWRMLILGLWSELPVLDQNQCFLGVVYREHLALKLIVNRSEKSCVLNVSKLPKLLKDWIFRILSHQRYNRPPPCDSRHRAG